MTTFQQDLTEHLTTLDSVASVAVENVERFGQGANELLNAANSTSEL